MARDKQKLRRDRGLRDCAIIIWRGGGGSKINRGGLNLNQSAGWGGGVRCNFLNICRGGLEVKLRGLISIHGLNIMYITCKLMKINFWNLLRNINIKSFKTLY